MYRSSPLVLLDSCLTAAACVSSACGFAVLQASDLALLVGNVAKEEFNNVDTSFVFVFNSIRDTNIVD